MQAIAQGRGVLRYSDYPRLVQEDAAIRAHCVRFAILPCLLACLAVLSAPPRILLAQSGLLPGPKYVGTLGGPSDLVVTDLNRDSRPDLLMAGSRSGILVFHEGQEGGGFSIPRALTVSGQPFRVAAADLDRDSWPDLIWIDEVAGTVHWTYGTGVAESPFAGGGSHLEKEETSGILVTDLDQDQWPDVVVSVGGADQLALHYNDGSGWLLPAVFHRVGDHPGPLLGSTHPQSGTPRIIVAQQGALSRNIAIYDGVPPLLQQELVTGRPLWLDSFYWDDDALLDLMVVSQDGSGLQVHEGRADGSYELTLEVSVDPGSVSAVELDRIGQLRRLIVGEAERHRVTLFEGIPGEALSPRQSWFVGQGFRQVVGADVDGDGKKELLVPLPDDDRVALLQQEGAGLRGYPSVVTGQLPIEVHHQAAGAGHPARVAVLHGVRPAIRIYEPNDNSLRQIEVLDLAAGLSSLDWAYLDDDDWPDLLAIRKDQGLELLLSDGSGGFQAPQLLPFTSELADFGHGDIDGDGLTDLAVADVDASAIRFFRGDGSGAFVESGQLDTAVPPEVVVLADLDLDGRAELLMTDGTSFFNLYFNDAGSYGIPVRSLVASDPRQIQVGLITPDPYPDIVITSASGRGSYSSYVSSAPRAYSVAALGEPFESGYSQSSLDDLSGDGVPDLALAPVTVKGVALRQGLSDGNFETQLPIFAASLVLWLDTGDVDGDDKADVILLDGLTNCLHILLQSPEPLVPVAPRLQALRSEEGVLLVIEGAAPTRVLRERDARVFTPQRVAELRWEVWDRSARPQGESYRLLDEGGRELDRVTAAPLPGGDTVLSLAPPAPNPGRESVQIRFRAPVGAVVGLRIVDARGRVVRTLAAQPNGPGWYSASWIGIDDGGARVARGRYHVDLRVDGRRLSRPLVWMGN